MLFKATLEDLMEVKEVQRERSTFSHTPDRLQVLLTIVVVLGQRRVWVVPAGVSGQERNPVVSASQDTADIVKYMEEGRRKISRVSFYSL